jgi:glycosyltransferase involved in cell wall biosynthesis
MYRASVVIPTHEHAATLPFAIRSVQQQGVDDIEILVIGDGVSDEVRATVYQLQSDDTRIRFFDRPKGPRTGEIHRDAVLREAKGRIVCYQCDDDLWLPGHLQAMEAALESADFAGAMQTNVDPGDRIRAYYFDLERPEFVEPWLAWKPNNFGSWASDGFGLQSGAHRLDAYLRLPEGWGVTADGLPTDQTMWHKFARQPWCRMRFLHSPVSLHFPTNDRRDWPAAKRADELARWTEIIESPDGAARIWRGILADVGNRVLDQRLADNKRQLERSALEAALRASLESAEQTRLRTEAELTAMTARCKSAEQAQSGVEDERDALLASTSWRLTKPLRAAANAIAALKSRRGA